MNENSGRKTCCPSAGRFALAEVAVLNEACSTWPAHWPGAWFGHRLIARSLAPVCQVAYDRTARLAHTLYGPARLTLDERVTARPIDHIAFQDGASRPVPTDRVILELKFRVEMPLVFKELVRVFALNPSSLSKYRLSMAALGLATESAPVEEAPCPTF